MDPGPKNCLKKLRISYITQDLRMELSPYPASLPASPCVFERIGRRKSSTCWLSFVRLGLIVASRPC